MENECKELERKYADEIENVKRESQSLSTALANQKTQHMEEKDAMQKRIEQLEMRLVEESSQKSQAMESTIATQGSRTSRIAYKSIPVPKAPPMRGGRGPIAPPKPPLLNPNLKLKIETFEEQLRSKLQALIPVD